MLCARMDALPREETTGLPYASKVTATGRTGKTVPIMCACFGAQWSAPSVFWFVGGTDAETYAKAGRDGKLTDTPTNHNPGFAPVIHPSLQTGVQALVVAGAWLLR